MADSALLLDIRNLLERICDRLGLEPVARIAEEFSDVDPEKLYTVRDLVKLRGGTPQAYYKAIDAKRLRETKSGGRRQVKGADLIAYLQSKR